MTDLALGRWTHAHTGDVTVFLIGMRINKWWRPDAWIPTLMAMGPMIAEVASDPTSGFLGYRVLLGMRGPTVVQYWKSSEDVYRYANNSDAKHRPAWAAFNRRAKKSPGTTGVWHETYPVARAESIYVDCPPMGLAAATSIVRVTGKMGTARGRLAVPTHP